MDLKQLSLEEASEVPWVPFLVWKEEDEVVEAVPKSFVVSKVVRSYVLRCMLRAKRYSA